MVTAPAVRFERVSKRFPGVLALNDVSFAVAPGTCHALCGENGAGKSTLGKLLAGIHRLDHGELFLHGAAVHFASPRDALLAGIAMVHQELSFCENLSIAENLCLSQLPARRGMVARRELQSRAEAMLAAIGVTLDVQRAVGSLSVAHQQLVQIAAAIGSGARIIVFDEPTSSLSQPEVEQLFAMIGVLKARGVTCIYISHRLSELFHICDAVSVLRDGQHVATRMTADLTEAELVRLMIGRPLDEYFPRHLHGAPGEELLRVVGLSVPGKLTDISFELRAGEVLGLAGLVGAGRTELAQVLFGLEPTATGRIEIDRQGVQLKAPRDAMRHGVGLVPEDRKRQGLVLSQSALHNTTLPILDRLSRFGWIRRPEERALADAYFDRLRVAVANPASVVAGLSGGNQQKIVLARWLAARCRILILDEPTRGVDVGAKAEIHALIDELASQGKAILLISSELPELINLSSRILVLRTGRIVAEVSRANATQDGLLRLMAGLAAERTN